MRLPSAPGPPEGPGGVFSSLKNRGGVLSGAVQVIAVTELALPEITGICNFQGKILCFNQIANYLVSEGTVPVPPEPPLRFAMVLYYLLWNSSRGDDTAAGANPTGTLYNNGYLRRKNIRGFII